jgi:hypothetical protein
MKFSTVFTNPLIPIQSIWMVISPRSVPYLETKPVHTGRYDDPRWGRGFRIWRGSFISHK